MQHWLKIVNKSGRAEMFIYDYIGMHEEGVFAKDFIQELRSLEAKYTHIDVRINSAGGQMQEGIAIYNALKQSKSYVSTYIDGLAASMAAVIAMAGKKVYMARNARLMTHEPQNFVGGNATALREAADIMDGFRDDIAKVLAEKAGVTADYARDNWVPENKDKWFTADEALTARLVDEIYDDKLMAPTNDTSMERLVAFYKPQLETNFNLINQPASMKRVIAVLNGSKLLNLTDAATEELVAEGVATLVNQLSAKEQVIAQKDAEITRLQNEAAAAKIAALKDKAVVLVDNALSAKKILAAQKDNFVNLASQSEDGYNAVKGMLDSMQGYTPVMSQLKDTVVIELPASRDAQIKLHDDHAKAGTLNQLPADVLKAVWKAKHGKEISTETLKALGAQ